MKPYFETDEDDYHEDYYKFQLPNPDDVLPLNFTATIRITKRGDWHIAGVDSDEVIFNENAIYWTDYAKEKLEEFAVNAANSYLARLHQNQNMRGSK